MSASVLLLVSGLAACAAGIQHRGALAADMQPEAVAKLLGEVQNEWVLKGSAALRGRASNASTLAAVQKSCATIAKSIVQGSDGRKDDVLDYMKDVCGADKAPEEQKGCKEFSAALGDFMTADEEHNRDELDYPDFCAKYYHTSVLSDAGVRNKREDKAAAAAARERAKRAAVEKARKEAERKARQEAAEKAEKEAAAKRKLEQEAKDREETKEREKQREAEARAEAERQAQEREKAEAEVREAEEQARKAAETAAQKRKELTAKSLPPVSEESAKATKRLALARKALRAIDAKPRGKKQAHQEKVGKIKSLREKVQAAGHEEQKHGAAKAHTAQEHKKAEGKAEQKEQEHQKTEGKAEQKETQAEEKKAEAKKVDEKKAEAERK